MRFKKPFAPFGILLATLATAGCTSFLEIDADERSATQRKLQIDSKSGLLLIELPEGSNVREVAEALRLDGIRPLVTTPDSQIIIEALEIDPNILPAESVISELRRPFFDFKDDEEEDGGEEPIIGEEPQSAHLLPIIDSVMPTQEELDSLEKRKEGDSCWNPPYCFPTLSGTVGIQVFFPESRADALGAHEDWQPGEIEDAMKTFRYALASLARVAPDKAQLTFHVTNLGPMDVPGEPTFGGYGPDAALEELLPLFHRRNGLEEPGPFVIGVRGLYRSVVSQLVERDGFSTVTFVGVARDKVSPFASVIPPPGSGLPFYWNWYPSALFGAPYARALWTGDEVDNASVFIHEILHTFGALDQYRPYVSSQASNDCTLLHPTDLFWAPLRERMEAAGAPRDPVSGRIISNGNSEVCNLPVVSANKVPDIMNARAHYTTVPWFRPYLSWFTRAQIGWSSTRAMDVTLTGFSAGSIALAPRPEVRVNGVRHLVRGKRYRTSPLSSEFRLGDLFLYETESTSTSPWIFPGQLDVSQLNGVTVPYTRIDCASDRLSVDASFLDDDATFGEDGRTFSVQRRYEAHRAASECPSRNPDTTLEE